MRTVKGRYECVVFDLDGTLLDTRRGMLGALNLVLGELARRPVSAGELAASMHHGLGAMLLDALERTGPPLDHDAYQLMYRRLSREYLQTAGASVTPYPELTPLLRALRRENVWTGVCTNQTEDNARALLHAFDLLDYFGEVVGRDTFSFHKPHPMPLIWLMGRSRARQAHTLFVGDSEVDAQCAAGAGVRAVLMEHGYGDLRNAAPHATAADFASLRDAICA